MNIFRRTTALLATLFCLVFALAGAPSANAGTTRASAEDLARLPKASLVIESAGKRLPFDVWVAATPERRAQGLMFVKTLPKNGGMLFLFPAPMVAAFWMKNTFMPLDLLFVRENGTIARIAENARPHDLSPLPGGEPVLAVLELAGGTAAKLGLRAGDRLVSTALRASEQ